MRAGALIGAVGVIAALPWLMPAARAQDVRITAPAPSYPSDEKPLTPEESEILGRALLFDPSSLTSNRPERKLKLPGTLNSAGLDVKNTDKPDGSSSVAVKRPLIDTPDVAGNVGADLNLAAQPSGVYPPRAPLPGNTTNDRGSAAAWASVGLPNVASVDARVDPTNDLGKIGGKLSHAVPVGKDLSVTLEDSYSMTENFSPAAGAPATGASLAAPPPATAAPESPGPAQVFDNSKSVKFNVMPTGTTFGAGWTTASNDPVTHHTLSADQKLIGPLHVTTAVTDVGQPTESKSITAGFKLNW